MKRNFMSAFLCAVLVVGMFTSCESDESPLTDNTKLWPAPQFSQDGDVKYGFINAKGDWAILPTYDVASTFSSGVALVGIYNAETSETTFCYIDKNGNQKGSFKGADQHYCGFARASMDGERIGFVDASAEFKIQPIYESVSNFSDDFARYYDEAFEGYGFIDKKGDVALAATTLAVYDYIGSFSEGLACYGINGDDDKYGFIDKKGKIAIAAQFDDAYEFSDGLALVEMNDRYGYINKKGEMKIQAIYEDADYFFEEGLAPIEQNGKWGYINKSGDIKISPIYDYAAPFCESLAGVEINGKYGVINTRGDLVIPAIYDDYGSPYFHNGLIFVVQRSENSIIYSYIDKKGETVWSTTQKFDSAFDEYASSLKAVKVAGKEKKSKPTNHFTLCAPRR